MLWVLTFKFLAFILAGLCEQGSFVPYLDLGLDSCLTYSRHLYIIVRTAFIECGRETEVFPLVLGDNQISSSPALESLRIR